jgi:type IV secretion system protein VirB6
MTALIADAGHNTPMPTVLAPLQTICYYFVEGLLGIASGIIFLINCSAFIFYGVAALFGPLMIPLYLTETFRGKFLHFVEVLLSLAMIRAVAAAFIFVWSQFLTGFMTQTFHGDYSIAMWLANLIPFTTIFVAFILNMFLIPSVTQMIFGGGAGLAGKLGETAEKIGALVAAA